jgi:hypothetical protein
MPRLERLRLTEVMRCLRTASVLPRVRRLSLFGLQDQNAAAALRPRFGPRLVL